MSVNFNSANRPQNNNIPIGPRPGAPQAPQGEPRPEARDALASPPGSECWDICGWVESTTAFLGDLWHRFLRWIGLEASPELAQEDPVGLDLPPRRAPQEPDPFDPQLLDDLALALQLQEENQPPKPPRVVPPPPPKGLYPVAPAPYKIPEEFLFSDPNALLSATQKYFEEFHVTPPKRLDFSDIASEITIKQLFETLLKKYEGICIGESHADSAPKYVLCYFMPLFVQLGVDTLYIEGYPYQTYQQDFDSYFKPETRAEDIPPELESCMVRIAGMQGGMPCYTERDVIIAAKKAGIRRVICIDTTASKAVKTHFINGKGNEAHGVARTAAMNYQAKCNIDYTMGEREGKCLIWAGTAHTSRCGGVPSLEQLCMFPSIAVRDENGLQMIIQESAKIDPSPHCIIFRESSEEYAGRKMESDFEITMPTPLKGPIRQAALPGLFRGY